MFGDQVVLVLICTVIVCLNKKRPCNLWELHLFLRIFETMDVSIR